MYTLNCGAKGFFLSNGGSPSRGASVRFATEVTSLNSACKNASVCWNGKGLIRKFRASESDGGYPAEKVGQRLPETLMARNTKPYRLNLPAEER